MKTTYKDRVIRAFRCLLDDLHVKDIINDDRRKQVQDILDGTTVDEKAYDDREGSRLQRRNDLLLELLKRSKSYVARGWHDAGQTESGSAYELLKDIEAELKKQTIRSSLREKASVCA